MKKFNVIIEDVNTRKFVPYDIIPYLVARYKDKKPKDKPITFDEFKKFIEKESMYQWWSRSEYEVVLQSWPIGKNEKKIDVHWQVMMNIDRITEIIMEETKKK